MGVTEETFRLVNEVKNADQLAYEEKQLKAIAAAEYELADVYEVVVQADRAVEAALEDLNETAARTVSSVNKVSEAKRQGASAARGWTTAIQQGGYALGDLGQTSGDLGQKLSSVTNNIQFMTAGLGPLGVAIGVATVAGVSLYRNWDLISSLWEDRTPIDTVTAGLHALEDQVKANGAALDKLREKGSLNLSQLEEWNRLTAEQTDLEAKLSKQREVEAAKKAHGPDSDQRSRELGGAFGKAVDELGGLDAVAKGFATAAAKRMPGGGTDLDRKQLEDSFAARIVEAMKGNQKAMADLAIEERLDKTGFAPSLAKEVQWHDPREKKARDWRDKAQEELDAWEKDEAKKARKQDEKIGEGFLKDEEAVRKKREAETLKAVEEIRKLGNALDKQKPEADPALALAEMQRRRAEAVQENRARRNVMEFTGGGLGQAGTIEAGRRAAELQRQGLDEAMATQQAVLETQANLMRLAGMVNAVGQNNRQLNANNRRLNAALARASQAMGALNAQGGGGEN
jgi:hypothetical protein